MHTKDDPLGASAYGHGRVTLFLEREGMLQSRDAYWEAFSKSADGVNTQADRRTWDIAHAAAIAAFEFLMSGKLEPR